MTDHDDDQLFTAACVQFDVRPGDVAENLASVRAGLEEAAEAGARLCVLPELWSTSFSAACSKELLDEAEAAEQELRNLSGQHHMVIVGSTVEAEGGAIYNTAYVHDDGNTIGSYRKVHLFSPNAEDRYHTAGESPLVLDTSVGRVGVMICYDLRFPELGRYYLRTGAEIVVVPGQWPEARSQHWRTLLRARAIENEVFVIGCNRTGQEPSLKTNEPMTFPGDGRIVDPTGEILASGSGEAGAVVAEIERRKVRTMRRILPVERDQRPSVYRRLFEEVWDHMVQQSREGESEQPDP
ncbi:MAG: carbon-nitrogen family hydrolase [Planctomycetes bacterium]|nr:carbon-nitrogen family hydrolase [Planctomycetota bacterium]